MNEGGWLIVIQSPDDRIHSMRVCTEETRDKVVAWLHSVGFKKQNVFWTFDSYTSPPKGPF
jgi:hypothetical protein